MNKDPLAFLQHFGDSFWLQTFDDKKRKDRKDLVHDYFLEDIKPPFNMPELDCINEQGAGVYFCVNELRHMHKKRNADNVECIQAFFCDLDGAPLDAVLACNLKPNIVVHSSAARYHAYWLMDDYVAADRRLFKELQRSIAKRFNGDESVSDLCRVMRLPGFYNMKKEPFMVTYEVLQEKPYSLKEVQDEFGGQNVVPIAVVEPGCSWASNNDLAVDAGKGGIENAAGDFEFDAARLRGALLAIDPDQYETWITVMLALKGAAFKGDDGLTDEECYEYFIEWSQASPKFDLTVCEAKWQGTISRGEVGLGTIFRLAQDAGWKGTNKYTKNEDEGIELFKKIHGLK